MPTRRERIAGGLCGLLIGDAVGVPYEFNAPEALPPLEAIEMIPPAQFRRTYDVPPGTWSDDGAQALALLDSLLACDQLDPEDLGKRLLAWYDAGDYAIAGHVFDVGIHTSHVLGEIRRGTPVLVAGAMGQQARGNGSLMRSLPLVLWHQGSDAELVIDAQLQSAVTHGDLYCQVCCALYCLWGRRILHAVADPWESAVATLRQLYASEPESLYILNERIRPDDPPEGQGHGYVIDCLRSARWAMEGATYEAVIKRAIALGHDTDTTACVAGGVAGLREGFSGIPQRWRDGLQGLDIYQPLLKKLLQRETNFHPD